MSFHSPTDDRCTSHQTQRLFPLLRDHMHRPLLPGLTSLGHTALPEEVPPSRGLGTRSTLGQTLLFIYTVPCLALSYHSGCIFNVTSSERSSSSAQLQPWQLLPCTSPYLIFIIALMTKYSPSISLYTLIPGM